MNELIMIKTDTDAPVTDAVLTLESPEGEQACAVCPHPWAEHDTRDVRFCTATAASSSPRGCICR